MNNARKYTEAQRQAAHKFAVTAFKNLKPIRSERETASIMGISRIRVRQLERSALAKLHLGLRALCPERVKNAADAKSSENFTAA